MPLRTMHGGRWTRLYSIWNGMRKRCTNPNCPSFHMYGGRGITICPEWDTFPPFRDWALAHGYTADLSIDRINNNGNYSPENCRWATRVQQNRNQRSNRAVIRSDGRIFATMAEAAEATNLRRLQLIYTAIWAGHRAGGYHWDYLSP